VALDAVHPAFHHGMVIRQVELRMDFQVALIANGGVLAGIDNELPAPAAARDMLAASAVAGFAARFAGPFQVILVKARVRTGGEDPGNVCVAVGTDLIPNERGAFYLGWIHNRPVDCRTGGQQ
jgi:hypothetical protein